MINQLLFPRVCSVPVPIKTASGKTYSEIASELAEPLPPEIHGIKDIGYNKKLACQCYWGYVSYPQLRDRLSQIVGNECWRFEIVSCYHNGEGVPVMVGILNVLGVEKQGFGYGHSHDSYKGSRDEIAYADAFKNAAEAHGLGAYLDNQEELVLHLIRSDSKKAIARGRMLAVQFQKENAVIRAALDAIGQHEQNDKKTTVTPPAQPKQPKQQALRDTKYLYPQHNDQVRSLRDRLGISADDILTATNGIAPGNLPPVEFQQLLIHLAATGAVINRDFSTLAIAKNALEGSLSQSSRSGIPFYQRIDQWLNSLEINSSKRTSLAEKD